MAKGKHEDQGTANGQRETVSEEEAIKEAEANLEEGVTDHANYVSKITIATMGCNPSQAKADNKQVPVCRIGGHATGVKFVDNPNGGDPFVALQGMFFGINFQKNTMFRSGVCYLPGGYHENVLEELETQEKRRQLPDDDPNKRSKFEAVLVEFDLAFDSQPAGNLSGYSYIAKSLRPITKADPLAEMIKEGSVRLLEHRQAALPAS